MVGGWKGWESFTWQWSSPGGNKQTFFMGSQDHRMGSSSVLQKVIPICTKTHSQLYWFSLSRYHFGGSREDLEREENIVTMNALLWHFNLLVQIADNESRIKKDFLWEKEIELFHHKKNSFSLSDHLILLPWITRHASFLDQFLLWI